ncbi:MAG: HAMP domain-containing histidine kinase [Lachnospiraceae bacterium]|nr:HAMP domain-containing histidine kinase [Lachnospiraceae bacterium]
MSNFRKILILYTVLMMAALAVILNIFKGMNLSVKNVESYNEQELTVYKQVWDNVNESFDVEKDVTQKQILILWAVILVLGYAFILLVYFLLVKPVKEMEEFASSIAKGNLDVPLPIHKNNMFGSFTESFDLMREELKASRQREIEAQKAKREMVAELSHDLKTPVATIQATCEVLELKVSKELEEAKKEADQSQKKIDELNGYLEKISYISNKSETINQLVGNVFHATLDDMEEVKIEPSENDSRLIEGYFNNLKEYGNIILDNHIPECLVYFDKLRMEQVIDNIVGNSYKYAETDIHVSFAENQGDGLGNGFVRIKIRDEGPGVDEEELPLILEKYYRGKNTNEKQGYGLGLYLVNYYMEKQGGGMEYYNDNGFVVELHVKKV